MIAIVTTMILLALGGAIAVLPPPHRRFGLCAGIAALVVAVLLGFSEAGGTLDPDTWLLAVAVALAVLAWFLREEPVEAGERSTETDQKTEVFR